MMKTTQNKFVVTAFFCLFAITAFTQTLTPKTITINANCAGFYEYLPINYNSTSQTYPTIIYCSGAEGLGNGSTELSKLLQVGIPYYVNQNKFPATFTVNGSNYSFIVIAPQFKQNSSAADVQAVIDYAIAHYRVDRTRIYMCGYSVGGGATFRYASSGLNASVKLAAISPCSAYFSPYTDTGAVYIAKTNLPVWAWHSNADEIAPVNWSQDFVNAINSFNPTPLAIITRLNGYIHTQTWQVVFDPQTRVGGFDMYEWMLQYQRSLAPFVDAGANKSIVLPYNSLIVSGTAVDPDGTVQSYQWSKVSGPDQFTINTPTLSQTTISNLVAGTYQFELRATDNSGLTGKDTMQIVVYPQISQGAQRILINEAPTSNAINGADQFGHYWNNMTDARAGIRVTNAITTTNVTTSIGLEVINRIDGTFNTSANGIGNTNTSTVVGDYPANAVLSYAFSYGSTTPVGRWRIFGLLPQVTYTIKFWGYKSGVTDGRFIQIKKTDESTWFEYNSANNTNFNNAAVFTITGVSEASFDIRTKNGSSFGYINVVDIQSAATSTNKPPLANAGSDQTITLPISTTTLLGSGNDSDGTVNAYSWARISGPTQFNISNSTVAQPTISNLIQGTYGFELTVTDNNGATGKDTVLINVNPDPNIKPTANAGTDQALTLPTNTITLSGSGNDADGFITAYSWHKISGPNQYSFIDSTQAQTTLNNLIQGIYLFELTVTDNGGAKGKDTVAVTVNPDPNLKPVANAGTDQSITLPANIVSLNGGGNDPDGYITAFSWHKISGPSSYTFVDSTLAQTDVNSLIQGTYSFELTVTDNNGATGKDTLIITVNPAPNIKPTANAGIDQTITLPANIVTLSGNGNDPDGFISAYGWKKVAGPAQFTITDASAASTTVTNLAQGTYQFELKVTDNAGASGKDTVFITVNPDPNIKPTANAGIDKSITLPVNTITLSGGGNDPDGSITAFSWHKISGPSSYAFVDSTQATVTINNLVQGTYTFELTVTDNNGATGKDTALTVVNPDVSSYQRVLINIAPSTNVITGADQFGHYWNNMTDGRAGIRVSNAVTTTNLGTTLGLEVITRLDGTYNTGANGLNNLNTSGAIGDYPQNAVLGYAFTYTPGTQGKYRIFGLDANRTYTIKFWGFRGPVSDNRTIQIKQTTETTWKEYNCSNNSSATNAAVFSITGVTEVSFDIRTKTNSQFGYINVIDIESNPTISGIAVAQKPAKENNTASSKLKDAVAYPNPAGNEVNIKMNNTLKGDTHIEIFSESNKLCASYQFIKQQNEFTKTLSLSTLKAGVYFIKISIGDQSSLIRIVKL